MTNMFFKSKTDVFPLSSCKREREIPLNKNEQKQFQDVK